MKLWSLIVAISLLPFTNNLSQIQNTLTRNIAAIPKDTISQKIYPKKNFSELKLYDKEIIIALIDTGVDVNHVALKEVIWTNRSEDINNDGKCTKEDLDGLDQDGNGFIDDCHGWNFANDNNDPSDKHGHGTHIAGIIAAIIRTFPSHNIKIMPIKYYDPAIAKNHIKSTVDAINYAITMGASIINYSAGGDTPSIEEKNVIIKAQEQGIVFIAAAGNETNDVKKIPYYPSSYNLSNIISVAALDKNGNLFNKSNWGKSVDIAAPGYNILSSLPENRYGNMSGTSMAAAYVTGTLALIMAEHKCSPKEAINIIKANAIKSEKLTTKIANSRQLNPIGGLNFIQNDPIKKIKLENIFKKTSIIASN